MIIPDVNLLLYATISAFPQHLPARSWWEAAVNGSETIGLTAPAIFGFLRLSTNARIFTEPMSVDAAGAVVHDWLAQPNVELLSPSAEHLDIALRLLTAVGTGGNLTTDAQLAAYAIEWQGEMYSNDTDFARFSGLRWVNPLAV